MSLILKVRHEDTVPVLVWLSGTECYLQQFFIVVSPGGLPTFLSLFYWYLLLFVVLF